MTERQLSVVSVGAPRDDEVGWRGTLIRYRAQGSHIATVGFVFDSRDIRLALTEVLRTVEADVVLTLPPSDYNNDHIMAGQIALHASLMSAINTIHGSAPPLPRA